jgi:hypothetical protein
MLATVTSRAPDARWRSMLLAALIAAACIAYSAQTGAAPAHATTFNYCGVLLNSGTWCGNTLAYFTYNSASYNGGGSVIVCQHVVAFSTGVVRYPPTCGYNDTASAYTSNVLSEAEVTHSSGSARHTIYGSGNDN